MHPAVVSTTQSVDDQQSERCPFLSAAIGTSQKCIKPEAARGVCTISCESNGVRQDWLVCPYRALSNDLVATAIRQLFGVGVGEETLIAPALTLDQDAVRDGIGKRLAAGNRVFIYFDKKTGGELSIPATTQSPEFSFDVTIIELALQDGAPHIGRFGILEIQTMDFHGSYKSAVRNLREGLRMHPSNFAATVQSNQWWLSEDMEGPNIANVFKRTFYQMMFKFGLGQHARCAGCVLAIPRSVWDSWQKHLASPPLALQADGTYRLLAPGRGTACSAWIYVFDTESSAATTPSPVVLSQMIGTDAPSMAYWALEKSPAAALSSIDASTGFLAGLSRRLKGVWPDLAKTAVASVATTSDGAPVVVDVKLKVAEQHSDYAGPTKEAVDGDERKAD
jgi:hypothetical protein